MRLCADKNNAEPMKTILAIQLILLSLVMANSFCKDSASVETHDSIALTLVIIAERDVVDLTSEYDLLRSKSFLTILENPKEYVEEIKSILKRTDVSDQQKHIAVLSVQSLPFPEAIIFWRYIIDLRLSNKISDNIARIALFPDFEWNTLLAENYQNPEVESLLLKIERSRDFSESSRELAGLIRTGEIAEEIVERRRDGILRKISIADRYR
jgi:hypothetical protein